MTTKCTFYIPTYLKKNIFAHVLHAIQKTEKTLLYRTIDNSTQNDCWKRTRCHPNQCDLARRLYSRKATPFNTFKVPSRVSKSTGGIFFHHPNLYSSNGNSKPASKYSEISPYGIDKKLAKALYFYQLKVHVSVIHNNQDSLLHVGRSCLLQCCTKKDVNQNV